MANSLPSSNECVVIDKSAERAALSALFGEAMRKEEERRAALPLIRANGLEALHRLMQVAQGHSGQGRYIAAFLLGLYNGTRFPFDLTDLRCIDFELFEDCLAVLKMDFQPAREVHCYFANGGKLFEQLAKDWGIRDRSKEARQ